MLSNLSVFLKESKQELRHVNWPTRQETIRYTVFVIGLSLALAIFLGFLDFVFLQTLNHFLIK